MCSHLSSPAVAGGIKRSTRRNSGPLYIRLFDLAQNGVCPAPGIAVGAVSSYLAVSPLPRYVPEGSPRRFVFCGTFRRSPGAGVTSHPALLSPDFPLRARGPQRLHDLLMMDYSTIRSGVNCYLYFFHRRQWRRRQKGSHRLLGRRFGGVRLLNRCVLERFAGPSPALSPPAAAILHGSGRV